MDPESGPLLDCLVFVHPADLPHNQYGFTKVTKEAGVFAANSIAKHPLPHHRNGFHVGYTRGTRRTYALQLAGFPFYDEILTVTDKYSRSTIIIPGNKNYTAKAGRSSFLASVPEAALGLSGRPA